MLLRRGEALDGQVWGTHALLGDGPRVPRDVQMNKPLSGVSHAFETFFAEAPTHAKAWMGAAESLSAASALDEKTSHLAYLSVLAALRLESGVWFHVQLAKRAGASRAEVASAILLGLPAAGTLVIESLPTALAAYDAPSDSRR